MVSYVTDYDGNTFSSVEDMCKHHNVSVSTYNRRTAAGWCNRDALTNDIFAIDTNITDFSGNMFRSFRALADAYGVSPTELAASLKAGVSLEVALKTNCKPRKVKDHKGVEYKSKLDMCEAYNISLETLNKRLLKGISLEDALTRKDFDYVSRESLIADVEELLLDKASKNAKTSKIGRRKKEVEDGLGNTFSSMVKLCKFHNADYGTYTRMLKCGSSPVDALEAAKEKTTKIAMLRDELNEA